MGETAGLLPGAGSAPWRATPPPTPPNSGLKMAMIYKSPLWKLAQISCCAHSQTPRSWLFSFLFVSHTLKAQWSVSQEVTNRRSPIGLPRAFHEGFPTCEPLRSGAYFFSCRIDV